MKDIELRTLRLEDEDSFKEAVNAFQNDTPPWQFAFCYDPESCFSGYVQILDDWAKGQNLPITFVPSSYYVGIVEGVVVGRVSIRHVLNDYLSRIGGHIGYGVIPSHRRKGYATEMLRKSIPICATLGIDRVLVTCNEENEASRRTIEKCGGVYEGSIDDPESNVPTRRYWIDTKPHRK